MKINKTSLLTVEDIKPTYDASILELIESGTTNIEIILQTCAIQVAKFNTDFIGAYNNFQRANSLVRKIKSLPGNLNSLDQQKQSAKIQKSIASSQLRNKKTATFEYLKKLQEGKNLLHSIRSLLTGQNIQTTITMKTSKGTYNIKEKLISNYLQLTLSTYGGMTSGNPFSLAYEIDFDLEINKQSIMDIIETYGEQISSNSIYDTIWSQKIPYLTKVKGWDYKTAEKRQVFNSKDAEIYELMLQMEENAPGSTEGWLTMNKYAELRSAMGGGKGWHSTGLQSGDVGLTQNKLLTERQNAVNIIRHSMVLKKLQNLQKLFSSGNSYGTIKAGLLKIFTIDSSQNLDEITRRTNEEAVEAIEELFKKIPNTTIF